MCLWRPVFWDPITSCMSLKGRSAISKTSANWRSRSSRFVALRKTIFLYGDQQSLITALYHLNRAQDLLVKNAAKVQALSSSRQVDHFRGDLQEYEQLISKCLDPASAHKCLPASESGVEFEAKIRKAGSSISDFAKDVAQRKRESIKQTIGTTVRLQLLAFALVAIGVVAVGSFVFAKVTKPLKLLEESTL